MKTRQLTLLIFLQAIATTITHAQSLPNKQLVSLFAPADIKVDGRATEWGNKFQAYNRATDVFYTVANNDENLYVLIKASQPDVIKKIILVGLVLFSQV